MTESPPDPPLAPDELVATAGEREVLEAFLDGYRDGIQRKAPVSPRRTPEDGWCRR